MLTTDLKRDLLIATLLPAAIGATIALALGGCAADSAALPPDSSTAPAEDRAARRPDPRAHAVERQRERERLGLVGAAPDAAPDAINTCKPTNYACDPLDPASNLICQEVCRGDGTADGWCLDYYPWEYQWCANHPGEKYGPGKPCMPSGEPLWYTHCEPGFLP